MRRWMIAAAGVLVAPGARAQTPELMVVGLPHLANPGRDIANTKVEDVLTPARQREIVALVERLAAFRPTHVAVEWAASDQAGLDRRYAAYRAGHYTLTANEVDQIGLRLAARLGLRRVDAVDWLKENPGSDADYDFVGWMKGHGRAAEWAAYQAAAQREADADGAFERCHVFADWVRHYNDQATLAAFARPYYQIATFGDDERNPGAAWVGGWYARNLRIYANLLRVGGAAGDRTVAIFGAGHGPLLRDDARLSGRFRLVELSDYLPAPSPATC